MNNQLIDKLPKRQKKAFLESQNLLHALSADDGSNY